MSMISPTTKRPITPVTACIAAALIITPCQYTSGQTNGGDITVALASAWPPEFYLVLVFCLLGLVVLAMQFALFWRTSERVSANDVMRAFSTTLILISVVALVGVGYSEKQVQPALGVIGTMLGYLMGRGSLAGDTTDSRPARRSTDVSAAHDT